MSKRSTFRVEDFRVKVNNVLSKSADNCTVERNTAFILLESILHDTGNYKGFNYLESERLPDGKMKPVYDETRRFYY